MHHRVLRCSSTAEYSRARFSDDELQVFGRPIDTRGALGHPALFQPPPAADEQLSVQVFAAAGGGDPPFAGQVWVDGSCVRQPGLGGGLARAAWAAVCLHKGGSLHAVVSGVVPEGYPQTATAAEFLAYLAAVRVLNGPARLLSDSAAGRRRFTTAAHVLQVSKVTAHRSATEFEPLSADWRDALGNAAADALRRRLSVGTRRAMWLPRPRMLPGLPLPVAFAKPLLTCLCSGPLAVRCLPAVRGSRSRRRLFCPPPLLMLGSGSVGPGAATAAIFVCSPPRPGPSAIGSLAPGSLASSRVCGRRGGAIR